MSAAIAAGAAANRDAARARERERIERRRSERITSSVAASTSSPPLGGHHAGQGSRRSFGMGRLMGLPPGAVAAEPARLPTLSPVAAPAPAAVDPAPQSAREGRGGGGGGDAASLGGGGSMVALRPRTALPPSWEALERGAELRAARAGHLSGGEAAPGVSGSFGITPATPTAGPARPASASSTSTSTSSSSSASSPSQGKKDESAPLPAPEAAGRMGEGPPPASAERIALTAPRPEVFMSPVGGGAPDWGVPRPGSPAVERSCRICLMEAEEDMPLIHLGCHCKDGMALVHAK
mmetsp:Transcript_39570/g.126279  ORF Transcript_39570/g.126279 Transcript_39570/m.126279 type:complete len:294 (-) Transcript_39570:112-993(-)